VVAEVGAVVAALAAEGAAAALNTIIDTDHGLVLIDRARFSEHLRDLLTLAQAASPGGGAVTLHVSRIFRSNIEETPVRRTGDSRLTIVPRASGDALRDWVQRAQPGAEVLSLVISDAGIAPDAAQQQRAFDAFASPRPGDPLGTTLATIRRTVRAANGTVWIDGSREGGTAVHILLPITGR
jgi:signal transduction histidine kinase